MIHHTIAHWLTKHQIQILIYKLRKQGFITSAYQDTLRTNASRLDVFCAVGNPRVLV